jgi:hypothetical protein
VGNGCFVTIADMVIIVIGIIAGELLVIFGKYKVMKSEVVIQSELYV